MPLFPLPHRRAHQHAYRGVTTAAAAASATMEREATATWEDDVAGDEAMGPAFRATLAMLEWPRLCAHVAAFAATAAGKAAVQVCGMWSAPAPAESFLKRQEAGALVDMIGHPCQAIGRLHCSLAWPTDAISTA